MRIMGVDCCTKSIACVILDENKKFVNKYFIESTVKDMDLRLWELAKLFDYLGVNIFILDKVDFVAVENPIYIQNMKASSGIAQVVGYVKGTVAEHNIRFMGVDNRSWKKVVLGNGAASKDMIMAFAVDNWGKENIINQDIADAALIALWGLLRRVK